MRSKWSRRTRRAVVRCDAFKAWPCLVLAVDPGEHCGVAILQRGLYVDSDCIDGFDVAELYSWIDNAVWFASPLGVPVVLVMEKPSRGGMPFAGRSPEGVGSVIACRKLWARQWVTHPDTVNRYRVDVMPQVWRARLLGLTRGPALVRVQQLRAERIACKDMASEDEAVACCIGLWGSHAMEVGAVVSRARLAKRAKAAV